MKQAIKLLIIVLIVIVIILMALLASNNKNNQDNNTSYIEIPAPPEEKYTMVKEKYECNEFQFVNVTTENLILTYFNKYKNNMLNNVEEAYNNLDSEYREKRFGNLDGYKKYVDENYKRFEQVNLTSYKANNTNNNYVQYICIDNNGNYYIFRETAIMQYTLMLDDYTLDLPEFLDKYNSANEQGKIALNIQKFMKAINAKDYGYAYNCLSNGFKNNYFEAEEQFKEYIENTFYESNNVEFDKFEEQSGVYTYKLIIKDANDESKEFTKTFIVKLNEGTNFELSFNIY